MRTLLALIALVPFVFATAAVAGPDEDRAALEAANAAFERSMELQDSDRAGARAARAEAIAGWSALVDSGIENHLLHLNIANAYALSGDHARAIVHYKRAERLDPTDARIDRGLAFSRSRVQTQVDASGSERVAGALLWWRGYLPRSILVGVFVVAWLALWAFLFVRAIGSRRFGFKPAVAMAVVAVLAGAALTLEHVVYEVQDSGVVVSGGAIGFNGPDRRVYEPTFTSPLGAGVEFRVIERRDGWLRVMLRDGRETWIESAQAELI